MPKVVKIGQQDIDEAISRVQLGVSTPEDGNLLRAWSAGIFAIIEQYQAGDDSLTPATKAALDGRITTNWQCACGDIVNSGMTHHCQFCRR